MSDSLERRARLDARFRQLYGDAPTLGCRAPGRVDLMGSHTDYNLGCVLTLPIGLDTWIAARPRDDRTVRLAPLNLDGEVRFELEDIAPDSRPCWGNYVRGVAAILAGEGLPLRSFDGLIHSTVPIGSGLSSSAALECAVATVFEALGGWTLDPVTKARLCQRAENQFVGVNCGILDQYTSCVGREGCALLLDCRDLSSQPVQLAPGIQVVICDTKARRELAASEYGRRRAQCEDGARRLGVRALREITIAEFDQHAGELPAEVAKRCRFIVEENDRVSQLARALVNRDELAIRQLTAASFRGACDLYEIGAPGAPASLPPHSSSGSAGTVGGPASLTRPALP